MLMTWTGNLKFVLIKSINKYTGEALARFRADGDCELYYNNSSKLTTKSDGIDVTGEVQCDSLDVDGAAMISGNVGIGTDSVSTQGKLYVVADSGNSNDVKIALSPTNSSGGTNPLAQVAATANGTYGSDLYFTTRTTGGTTAERVRIDQQGNVGIGITDPKRALHLDGGSGGVQIQLTNDTTGKTSDGDGFQLQVAGDGTARVTQRENLNLAFDTNNTERMRIDNSGRLLVGTTTVPTGLVLGNSLTAASSTGAEVVAFRSDTSVAVGDKCGAFVIGNSDTDGAEDHFVGMWGKAASTNGSMDLHFAAGRASYEGDTPDVTIKSGGNVGIGTASNLNGLLTLHQNDSQLFIKQSDGDSGFIVGSNNTNGNLNFVRRSAGSNTTLFTMQAAGGLSFNGDGAAANALYDYEEGTFTPTYASGMNSPGYQVQEGSYTKIGSLVTCFIEIKANSGTNNSSHLGIGGLPFTASNTKDQGGGYFGYRDDLVSNSTNIYLHIPKNSSIVYFYTQSGSIWAGNDGNGIYNRNIHVQVQYFT